MNIYYISFSIDEKFAGACVINGVDEKDALQRSHQAGINPGGEALIIDTKGKGNYSKYIGKLLKTPDEIKEAFGPSKVVYTTEEGLEIGERI